VPAGLKNIGNTCYFASLIQALFFLPNIQDKVLSFDESALVQLQRNIDATKLDSTEKIKLQSSKDIVQNLQRLFAEMLCSHEKYGNPTAVLESIVDDNGQKVPIYEQADIGEFFVNFLDRLQDGLGENKQLIRKMMGEELIKELASGTRGATVNPPDDLI
jgi:ubiquitin C-terminal hydrolase